MEGPKSGPANRYLFWAAVLVGVLVVVMGLLMYLESS